jgi:hypothetical protein
VRADWQHLLFATVPATAGAAFPLVVAGVVAAGVLIALLCAGTSRGLYDRVGRGGLFSGGAPPADGEGSDAERDEEVRQMLDARGDLRARRAARAPGAGPPAPRSADPTAAPATTAPEHPPPATGPPVSAAPAAVEELRQLVVARNARRRRRGLDPLDIDAEVARRLREL